MARRSKNKGVRGQNEVAQQFRDAYPFLEEGDITPQVMGQTGKDIILSPVAKSVIPFDIEVKYVERLNIYAAIKQGENNTDEGRVTLVAFRKNYADWYAAVPLAWLLQELTTQDGEVDKDKAINLLEQLKHEIDKL